MNLNEYVEHKPHRAKRILWYVVNKTLFRVLVTPYLKEFRNGLLRLFGAQVARGVLIYPSVDVWYPWKLKIGRFSCVGAKVNLYNKDFIEIGENVVVSQNSFLCTASHNINSESHTLITRPIILDNRSWVAADSFVGMGVTIGEGAVVGARAAVFKDVEPWTVVGGNPAKFIKKRVISHEK